MANYPQSTSSLFSLGSTPPADPGGGGGCLICGEKIESRATFEGTLGKGGVLLGQGAIDAFLKICELLQVSFLEILGDWTYLGGCGTKELPFCGSCLNGAESIVVLQKQLADLQKKIEEQTEHLRKRIQQTLGKPAEPKQLAFRVRALARSAAGSKTTEAPNCGGALPANIISSDTVAPSTSTQPVWPLFPSQEPQPSSSIATVTPTTATSSSSQAPVTLSDTKLESEEDNSYPQQDPDYPEDDDNANYSNVSAASSESETEPQEYVPPQKSTPRVKRRRFVTTPKERQPEHFADVLTDSQGRMTFEGIVITPIANGYQCGQCNVKVGKDHSTLSLRKAKIHIKGVHLHAYTCDICPNRTFSSQDILNTHYKHSHHETQVPCSTCGKPIKERYMDQHQYTHKNREEKAAALASGFQYKSRARDPKKFACEICNKRFPKRSNMRRHKITHVEAKFRLDFECSQCPKKYASKESLRDHLKIEHGGDNIRKRMCPYCKELFPIKQLRNHVQKHQKVECDMCGHWSLEQNAAKHRAYCLKRREKKENDTVACHICGKWFKNRKSLQDHRVQRHKGHWMRQVPFNLVKHVSVDNPREEPWDLLNEEGLRHLEGNLWEYMVYELEKMEGGWRCCTCQGEEDDDEGIMQHVRNIHVGQFKCETCTKRTKSLYEMELHVTSEHGTGSGEIYECQACGRKTAFRKSFKKHVWEHKSVWEVAELVNKGERLPHMFKKCQEMEEVLEGMGEELEYECVQCEETFGRVAELERHRLKEHKKSKTKKILQDGEKECPRCKKRYKNSVMLVKHFSKSHHKERRKLKIMAGLNVAPPLLKFPKGEIQCPRCKNMYQDSFKVRAHFYKCHYEEREELRRMVAIGGGDDGDDSGDSEEEEEYMETRKRAKGGGGTSRKRAKRKEMEEEEEDSEVDSEMEFEVKQEVESADEGEEEEDEQDHLNEEETQEVNTSGGGGTRRSLRLSQREPKIVLRRAEEDDSLEPWLNRDSKRESD